MYRIKGLLLVFCCFSFIAAFSQSISNEGTEFYAVFPSHKPAGRTQNGRLIETYPAQYSIFITGKQASSGTVTVGNGQPVPFNLPAGNVVTEIQVSRPAAYIEESESGRVLSKAIRVQVDPGKPKVVVYGHIFAGKRSAASLILPKESLGQEYYSINYPVGYATDNGDNYIVLVATEANTKIFLRKPDGSELVPGGITLPRVGDVYQYLSPDDLTGVRAYVDPATSACKKFAMFSGATNSAIMPGCAPVYRPDGSTNISSDPLYQQSYPVDSWGKTYGFVPFSTVSRSGTSVRTRGNMIRIVAKENNTRVEINGIAVATLAAGGIYQSPAPMNEAAFISADKPIAVAQYALTQACSGGGLGDPDMVILNPVEFNIKNITVYSSSKEDIAENYINVLIKTSAAASFRINGARPAGTFTTLRGQPDYSYLRVNLNGYRTQTFNLSADEGFNAIAYGFGDVESYAYSAGTNLASTQSLSAENPDTREAIENACSRQGFRVKVTLTSPVTSLAWQFEENGPFVEPPVGSPEQVDRNGTIYYEYYYPVPVSYTTAGQKTIKVKARYPSIGGCDMSEQEIDLIFDVYDPPEARFDVSGQLCAANQLTFTDKSLDHGNPITKWTWDFGDGTYSEEQNPAHTYSAPGTYLIKLTVQNSTTCETNTFEQTVEVSATPVPDFTVAALDCDDPVTTFSDLSQISEGSIVSWRWDFGDGTAPLVRSEGGTVSHRYNTNGLYKVSLTVTGDKGCEVTTVKDVQISRPYLEAGDDITILRGGAVNLNITAEGTNIRYSWTPAAGLDRDDVKNPLVSPDQDTRYFVTITTEEGCTLNDDIFVRVVEKPVIRNTFTPNGDGVNDTWVIDYLESYPDVQVNIFNRFGVQVYSSTGYFTPWDGIFNGQPLPVGTYYYVIDPKMGLPVYKGWVSILR